MAVGRGEGMAVGRGEGMAAGRGEGMAAGRGESAATLGVAGVLPEKRTCLSWLMSSASDCACCATRLTSDSSFFSTATIACMRARSSCPTCSALLSISPCSFVSRRATCHAEGLCEADEAEERN